jgi:O-methyltransferase/methyltransferase family protein
MQGKRRERRVARNERRACLHEITEQSMLETKTITPDRILDVGYAFWKSKALLSAVELDVFTALADGPLGIETLIARIGLHERGARDFFDALVALDLLRRDADGRYSNRPDTDHYLDRRKPTYLGGLLAHLNARHFQNWSLLTQALRTGLPQSGALATGSYPALYADAAIQEIFLDGMTGGSLIAAKAIADSFPWYEYKTFIDIGTAQGCVPVEIACRHPHLTGGGFDLPAIEPAFHHYVRKHELSDRLRFYQGDFFTDPLPKADVLVMGRILHNWDLPTKKMLLEKAYQALPQGGALIVYDPLIDDERCVKSHGLLSSLNMLIETAGGCEYTSRECISWLQHAGFRETRIEPLGDVHTAVIGFKNGPSAK